MTATIGWRTRARALRLTDNPALADAKLTAAYNSVFTQGREDVEMVLSDLAEHCGFYKTSERGSSADDLNFDEGKRAAFARIWSFLTLTDQQLEQLENAARDEAAG